MKDKKWLIALFFIFIILILIPPRLRNIRDHTHTFSYESYIHLNNIPLSINIHNFNLFHFIVAMLEKAFTLNFITQALPFLFGILSFILFYFVMLEIKSITNPKINQKELFFGMLFFIVSPFIIFMSTAFTPYSFIIVISLSVVLLTLRNRLNWASLFLVLLALTELFSFILMFLFFVSYLLYMSEYKKSKYWLSLVIIPFTSLVLSFFVFNNKILNFFDPDIGIANYFSEIGPYTGFPVFLIILFILGLSVNWKRSFYFVLPHLAFFTLLFISFFSPPARLFCNLVMVFYASSGIIYLIERYWDFSLLKDFVISIIIFSMVFSTVFTISSLTTEEPSTDMEKALLYLKKHSDPDYKVLSHPENDMFIRHIAEREPALYYEYKHTKPKKYEEFYSLFDSQNIKTTSRIFDENEIKYVVIDEKSREDIWPRPLKGLLFLLYYNEKFIKIREFNGVELWEYNPS